MNLRNPHVGVAVAVTFMITARLVVGGNATDAQLRVIGGATFAVGLVIMAALQLRDEFRSGRLKR